MEFKKYKLYELASVDISSVDKKSKEDEKPVRLCNFTDVYKNWAITRYHYSSLMKATAKDRDIDKFCLRKGQVAITKDSETRDDIGIPTYIADDFEDVVLGYHCALITPNENLDGKYLNAYLNSKMAKKYFEGYASGSGQRYTLTLDSINEIQIWAPDIDSQRELAKILSDLDKKIALNTRMNAELEAMAKQLYDYWFVQFDFPNENGKPYKSSGGKMVYNEKLKREIPECWDDKQICDIAHIIAGRDCPKNFSLTKSSKYSIPIYSNGIDNNGLYGYTDKSTSPARSVTVSARGTIGYPILRLEPFVPIIRLIVATPYDEGTDIYLYEYLRVIDIKNTGSVQPQLPVPEFSIITIPYPKNIEIIKAFSELTRKWYITIEQNRKYNEYLTHLRDSLLPMLMNGQVTVENLPIFWRI